MLFAGPPCSRFLEISLRATIGRNLKMTREARLAEVASQETKPDVLIVGNEDRSRGVAAGDESADQIGKLNPVDGFADAIVTAHLDAIQTMIVARVCVRARIGPLKPPARIRRVAS